MAAYGKSIGGIYPYVVNRAESSRTDWVLRYEITYLFFLSIRRECFNLNRTNLKCRHTTTGIHFYAVTFHVFQIYAIYVYYSH